MKTALLTEQPAINVTVMEYVPTFESSALDHWKPSLVYSASNIDVSGASDDVTLDVYLIMPLHELR